MSEAAVREAFRIQAFYCARMDAPIYARLCEVIADRLGRDGEVARRVLDWPGEPTRDALPLRLIGGLHALVLDRADAALAAVFAGAVTEPEAIAAVLAATLEHHAGRLLPYLDGPPQTNEPGRAAALMVGLIAVARRAGLRLETLEIGASAGLNLLIDRYGVDLGGVVFGPAAPALTLRPDWRGAAPEPVALDIVATRGCDVAPLDARDPAQARRLESYVWPEAPERLARLRTAIAMLRAHGVALDRADAADWIEARLAEPQAAGVTRVLLHSVVWQYLPEATADRVRAAMAATGARVTRDRPLAWVMMEPDRAAGRQLVRVRLWPDDRGWETVASAHAHAAWIAPGAPPEQEPGIALPDGAVIRAG
ncbi:hypothetical protein EV292_103395 [Sphingomonas sp. BK235]|nr:DUF2332 domain-containing protein [Sphingomonas sp. BK235]TCP34968.1 hypothetical protein EV292_103395 [Sphingomonas sp. BK235]